MDDVAAENRHQLRRLVWSIQSSYGRLNLLGAICDNWKYRDEIIDSYETELREKGARCDRVRIDLRQPSLKQSLQAHVEQEPELATSAAAVVTVLGADELLGLRLNQERSVLEQFLFSLHTRAAAFRARIVAYHANYQILEMLASKGFQNFRFSRGLKLD
ncbi:hypothetical protein PGN35_013890 [Nodosilinea sp. PGN35]|uniref:hypothetical protein n=1 Tax=Nodosilinea sp. PGN35 TaxID=3020489 RepID=UPI0023B33BD4|nr:hypothetical protein [Nodosilinea sp. TSF1-S3]MDF0364950.1 hypothetical protein [Nodosilinea sp. TSF1-S3]